jgi:CMP-N-acetylneuraminic acid synthetase
MTVAAVVPCKRDSERLPDKNTRPFASYPGGLLEVKLRQLLACRTLDAVVVNTDDDRALEIAARLDPGAARPRLETVRRAPEWSGPGTSTDQLIAHVAATVAADVILWTHVTSPLLGTGTYDRAVETYLGLDPLRYDSLMSVTRLQEFIWDRDGPKNYDRRTARWPRTQDLPAWYVVNSGIFLCSRDRMRRTGDRVGDHVYLLELDRWQSLDIDWPEDFTVAETAFRALGAR